ncbi:dTDP-4-dehydrorhamnose reductase [Sphingomonas sp. DG1-23]|uniref:dTDP-4-dehydrorhamnose reductase n=1 Tax=Sphingomonas sp. DG1-23 TaxID=3068316 RepID=UPI00273E852C|nr:dTDP-4-dehydrorhamnose reductase [Sphingomonas sp. DG1-23]MDP5278758.1 dTDP-4-dehydrorhamnose reductase [Sphingomonas sp. DG1-23]
MKVLVTGANGQVGLAIARTAPAEAEVIALSRNELDICNPSAMTAIIAAINPDVVINAAGYTQVDKAESEERTAFRTNGDAVGDLARLCEMAGAKLVHFSTDFVFDGAKGSPYAIDDSPAPLSIYGRSKLAGEQAALSMRDALVIRTAWVYSESGDNFVKTMLGKFQQSRPVKVVSDQVGSPTSAHSLAKAVWGLIAQRATGLHHFTDAGVCSWYDFAVAISEEALAVGIIGDPPVIIPIRSEDYPAAASRPSFSVLDKWPSWGLLGGPAQHWRTELKQVLASLKGDRND